MPLTLPLMLKSGALRTPVISTWPCHSAATSCSQQDIEPACIDQPSHVLKRKHICTLPKFIPRASMMSSAPNPVTTGIHAKGTPNARVALVQPGVAARCRVARNFLIGFQAEDGFPLT